MNAAERRLDRIENQVGALERTTPTIDDQKDTENRIRSLEALRWQLIGAASFFALIGSLLGPLLKSFLTGH